jgi:opacity protein-like surface antigen
MLTRKLATKGCFEIALFFAMASPVAFADFDTYSSDWPNHQAVVDERKIVVKEPVRLTEQQQACIVAAKTPRVKDVCKMYWKFGGWQGQTDIMHVRNQSYSPINNYPVYIQGQKKFGLDWEIGVGFTLNTRVRFELEYIHHKNQNYNPNPILLGYPQASMTSQVKSEAALITMFVDFRPVDYFFPFFGASTGFVWNQTRTTATGGVLGNGTATTVNRYGYPWSVCAGARMPLMSRYFIYVGYRYCSQSKMEWRSSNNMMKLQGQYYFKGFNFGVQGLIG